MKLPIFTTASTVAEYYRRKGIDPGTLSTAEHRDYLYRIKTPDDVLLWTIQGVALLLVTSGIVGGCLYLIHLLGGEA